MGMSTTVTGSRREVWDVITHLRAQTRHEILSIDDTTLLVAGRVPEAIRRRGPSTLRAAIARGVNVRQITTRAGLQADRGLGSIMHRAGGQARVVPTIERKISVLDRRVAMVALDGSVLANGFELVRDPDCLRAMVAGHQQLWDSGTEPVPDRSGQPPAHLAPVVAALASGETDEVAAARLGISSRSYSRRVAELLVLLEVRSRFQAGSAAARRGWI